MFLKFFTIILSALFFTENSHAIITSAQDLGDSAVTSGPIAVTQDSTSIAPAPSEPSSNATTTINYQGHDVEISAILALGNKLIKGQTPSSLNITAAAFQSITNALGYFNTSLAHGNLNQITDLPVLEKLFSDLLSATHKDINVLLKSIPAGDKPIVQAALTAASAITDSTAVLLSGGKVTPSGCFSCILGTTLTIAQQLATQQLTQLSAQQLAQNQPTA